MWRVIDLPGLRLIQEHERGAWHWRSPDGITTAREAERRLCAEAVARLDDARELLRIAQTIARSEEWNA